MESIHGHNVLNFVQELGQEISRESLLSNIEEHFGTEARFHTCSAENLSSEELVSLFLQTGKLEEVDGTVEFHGCACGCNH